MRRGDIVVTFFVTLFVPIINLSFATIYIPNVLSVSLFADWRLASTIIAFAGILHLGFADGMYRDWLKMGRSEPIFNLYTLPLIVLVISFLSTLVCFAASLYFDFYAILSLFFCLLLYCLFSFSTYYAQVFFSGNKLRFSLSSQSVLFVVLVLFFHYLKILNVPLVISSYGASTVPSLILMFKDADFSKTYVRPLQGLLSIFKRGFPLMFINLLIIVFINFDKLYARVALKTDLEYSQYALQSSLFVASCGLGIASGSLLISKKVHVIDNKNRFFFIVICVSIVSLISQPISGILNSLIKKYTVDYSHFILLSTISFLFFMVYVSYGRLYMISLSRNLFLLFPIYYLTIMLLAVDVFGIPFNISSSIVLASFSIIYILLIELLGRIFKGGSFYVEN